VVKTFFFVHGTGVREPRYTQTLSVIQKALVDALGADNVRVEPCYWGGAVGSSLNLNGATVPNFDATKAAGVGEVDFEIALWEMLYKDPFAELDLLAMQTASTNQRSVPGQEPPGEQLRSRLLTLHPDYDPLAKDLKDAGLILYFNSAREDLLRQDAFREIVKHASLPLTNYTATIARSLVARCLERYASTAQVDDSDGLSIDVTAPLPLSCDLRDRLVGTLTSQLNGPDIEKGPLTDWVRSRARRLIEQFSTDYAMKRRGLISGAVSLPAADVLKYQARPAAFQTFLRDKVEEARVAAEAHSETSQIIIIAHSLGGIIAVDALLKNPMPTVTHLVTVGSQSGVLCELDALTDLPFNGKILPGQRLPATFPKWLNIYDDRDFGSYLATPAFGSDRVMDLKVDNRQPFPESHSAYWTNSKVWEAIISHTKEA